MRSYSTLPLCAVLITASLVPVRAQRAGLDVGLGFWLTDSASTVYSASLLRPLLGPFDYGIGINHVRGPDGAEDSRFTGGEISVGMFRDGSGPYLVGAAGLGMRHSSGNFDAHWSAGAGWEFALLGPLSVGGETRYQVEDRASRGFWRLHPDDNRGMLVQLHVSLGLGGSRGGSRPPRRVPADRVVDVPATAAGGVSGEASELRHQVVETAKEAMGSPYRWGGAGEDGFDCSGLIQYAYREHGLLLPRTSRDQARMGREVDLSLGSLLPGDILGFADGGGGVTHVGLYVGDGLFIHSSSAGVQLSSLTDPGGDGRWWQRRWVQARRIIN